VSGNGIDGENVCATTCLRSVSLCRLNAEKLKRKIGSDLDLIDQNEWNFSVIPDELVQLKFDKEHVGGCGNCNPKRERAKHNGACPCCEVNLFSAHA